MNEKLAPPTTPPGIGLGMGYDPSYVTSSKATEATSAGLYRFASAASLGGGGVGGVGGVSYRGAGSPRKQQPRSSSSSLGSRKVSGSTGGVSGGGGVAGGCCPCFGCGGGGRGAGRGWQSSFWPALLANIGICALLVGYIFIGSFVFLTIENSVSLDENVGRTSVDEEPLATRQLADVLLTTTTKQQEQHQQQQQQQAEPQLMASTVHTQKDNVTKVRTSFTTTTKTTSGHTTTNGHVTTIKTITKREATRIKTTAIKHRKRRRRQSPKRDETEETKKEERRNRQRRGKMYDKEEDDDDDDEEEVDGEDTEEEEEEDDEERQRTVENIWDITVSLNILYKENWTKLAALEIQKFQDQLVKRLAMDLTLSTSSTVAAGRGGVATASGGRNSFHSNNVPMQQNADNDNNNDNNNLHQSHWSHHHRLSEHSGRMGSTWLHRRRHYGQQQQQQFEWNFATAFLYSLTVITTVGYGSISPRTTLGRMVTIGYATLGIPLTLVYLSSIGAVLAKLARLLCSRALCRSCCCRCDAAGALSASSSTKERELKLRRLRQQKHLQQQQQQQLQQKQQQHLAYCYVRPPASTLGPEPPTATPTTATTLTAEELRMLDASLDTLSVATTTTGSRHTNPFGWSLVAPIGLCLLLMLGYVAFGAVAVALLEGWPLIDGVYFCVMSLTTIGFCDLLPGVGLGEGGGVAGEVGVAESGRSLVSVWFCSLYILSGLTLTAMCVNVLHEEILLRMRVVVKFKKVAVATAASRDSSKDRSFYGPPPP